MQASKQQFINEFNELSYSPVLNNNSSFPHSRSEKLSEIREQVTEEMHTIS